MQLALTILALKELNRDCLFIVAALFFLIPYIILFVCNAKPPRTMVDYSNLSLAGSPVLPSVVFAIWKIWQDP